MAAEPTSATGSGMPCARGLLPLTFNNKPCSTIHEFGVPLSAAVCFLSSLHSQHFATFAKLVHVYVGPAQAPVMAPALAPAVQSNISNEMTGDNSTDSAVAKTPAATPAVTLPAALKNITDYVGWAHQSLVSNASQGIPAKFVGELYCTVF